MAASFASGHPDVFDGIFLFAAYPASPLPEDLTEVILVGSNDRVIRRGRLEEARQYASAHFEMITIEGGNHAGFGSYGPQKGDGEPAIPPEEQRHRSVQIIREILEREED